MNPPVTPYHWQRNLDKYRRLARRLNTAERPDAIRRLRRKLDILARRILRLNRQWRLGIATAALLAWLQAPVQAQPFPANFDLTSLNGDNGFRVPGLVAGDVLGRSVSRAGDVNGDGLDDFVLGAPDADPGASNYAGEAYVVFGGNPAFGADFDLGSLDGANGFRIPGANAEDGIGYSVAALGDFNGDGADDLLLGAPFANNGAGAAYVVFGNAGGFPATFNLGSLNGSNGFRIDGLEDTDQLGASIRGIGDINGDGLNDLAIGIPSAFTYTGEAYVVFGSDSGFGPTLELEALDGSNGFQLPGISEYDRFGGALSGLGDLNGDGIADFALGARDAVLSDDKNFAGEVYVIFGSDAGFGASLDPLDLNGSNGFRLPGIAAYDGLGSAVGGGGDVNGDGLDDLLVSAEYASPGGLNYAGESYVVFGSTGSFPADFDLSSLNGQNGFRLPGTEAGTYQGTSVHLGGDFNGDGLDELVIGQPYDNPGGTSYAGQAYVVFGTSGGFGSTFDLSTLDGGNGFRVQGLADYDFLGLALSDAGDVNADNVDDLLLSTLGSPGNRGAAYVLFGRDVGVSTFAPAAELPLRVYPNPASGTLWVELDEPQEALLSLYDPLGRALQVHATETGGGAYRLDLPAGLPAGVYSLQIRTGKGSASRKVIIR